jgi:hypothetical protein
LKNLSGKSEKDSINRNPFELKTAFTSAIRKKSSTTGILV